MVEVALRWMVHHSALDILNGNDGIVTGASTVEQLKSSLTDLEKGPLPKEVVDVLDAAWEITKSESKPYWHGNLEYTYGYDE
jgi:aflatoxin B1 aldehyde reductase